ncbi:MAG: hypothetical protein ACON4R_05550 [Akkermansiaceae bacterium]
MKGSKAWAVDLKSNRITARALDLSKGQYHPDEVKGRWLLSR